MELVYLYSSEGAQQAIPAAQEPLAVPVPQFMNGSVLAVDCTCNNGIVHFWFFQQMGRKGLFFFFFFFFYCSIVEISREAFNSFQLLHMLT